jgi:two-component system, chemotaxis family, chemotaxis protein CheY
VNSKSILVIEDDARISKVIQTFLVKDGHRVDLANNGDKGIRLFRGGTYDLVITDIYMPEKDGLEVIRDLRSVNADIPILAVSGGGMSLNFDPLRPACQMGATMVLVKPFGYSELKDALSRLFSSSDAPPSEA